MSIKHSTTVDIGDLRLMPKPIHLMQYDKSLPEITVNLTKDGQEFDATGYTATIRWGKPDKHGCTADGTVDGSTVTFTVTDQMACVAGESRVVIELVESDSSQAGTAEFKVIVAKNPIGDNTKVSESQISEIEKAIEAGQAADETLKKVEAAQAELDEVVEKADAAAKTINTALTAYNENAEAKTTEFNDAVTQAETDINTAVSNAKGYAEAAAGSAQSATKTVDGFDTHVTEKLTETKEALDTYTTEKEKALDTYTTDKETEIDKHVESVTQDITDAKTAAETAAETATNKASEAAQSAGYASSYKDAAQTYAGNAETSAQTATAQAETATQAAQTATAPTLGKVLEALYASQRTGKIYGVDIPAFTNNTSSTCEKTDDNTDLAIPTPATDSIEGSDPYLDIPLFQWMNCNYTRESDGTPIVTALEGSADYKNSGSGIDVGVVSMSYYEDWQVLDDGTIYYRRSDKKNAPAGIMTPCEPSVREDGSVMPYIIFPKYYSGIAEDGYLRSQYGLMPERLQSHNNMMTNYPKKGEGYHGGSIMRQTHAILLMALKYATKNSQKYFAGCTGYSWQITLQENSAEERTYFVCTATEANNIPIGAGVSVGYSGTTSENKDRGNTLMHAYADDATVLSKEVQDDGNYRIYLDCDPFVTVLPDGADESVVHVYATSMHWHAGSTDAVKGRYDGSLSSNTDNKHPFRLGGIEYAVGGYEVVSDTVMNIETGGVTTVYKCKRWADRKTALADIQSNYTKLGEIPVNGDSNSDYWIGDIAFSDGGWYPSGIGSSSALGYGDMCHRGGTGTGLREYLMGGFLSFGSSAGLTFLNCWSGLTGTNWYCLSAD